MRWSSRLLLAFSLLVHCAMLVGWRWQGPLVPFFFDATVLSGGRGLDFYSIYQAGYNARHGDDVYEGDPAKIEVVVPYFTPYRYLPAVAYTLGTGLSVFSPLTAYKIWVVVIELTLLLCVRVTYRRAGDPDLFARLAVMWLGFTPFYLELFMGQFSLVQAALVFGMLLVAADMKPDNGSDQTAGSSALAAGRVARLEALWLASVLWKINTIVFAPVMLRLRRFRALGLATVVITLTTVPYFLVFPAHLRDFVLNNFGGGVTGHELGNLGLRQLVFETLVALGAPPDVQRVAQLILVAVIVSLALTVTFRRSTSSFHGRAADLLSLWLVAFFLVSPQVWEHHHVMLLPVLVVAYWQKPAWPVVLIWFLLALPTPFGFVGLQPVIAANHDLRAFPIQPVWQPMLQHASKAVPTLLLFAHLLRSTATAPEA